MSGFERGAGVYVGNIHLLSFALLIGDENGIVHGPERVLLTPAFMPKTVY